MIPTDLQLAYDALLAASMAQQKRIDELESQVSKCREEAVGIAALNQQLSADLTTSRLEAELQAERIAELTKENERYLRDLNRLSTEIETAHSVYFSQRNQIERLEAEMQAERERLDYAIQAAASARIFADLYFDEVGFEHSDYIDEDTGEIEECPEDDCCECEHIEALNDCFGLIASLRSREAIDETIIARRDAAVGGGEDGK